MDVQVVIPTYNERENIEPLVEAILALPMAMGIVIVDDNSPDGTGATADALAGRSEAVSVVHRPGKLGLGTAHIAGIRRALAGGAQLVVTMDADFSHHPRYIPDLLAAAQNADIVIGSRYVPGGGTVNCGPNRTLLSRMANLSARTVLGLRATDCTAGFRCYRREVLEHAPLDAIFSNGYSFLIEMLYKCQRLGYRVAEVPIVFENRQRGSSKISKSEIMRAAYTVFRLAPSRLTIRKGARLQA